MTLMENIANGSIEPVLKGRGLVKRYGRVTALDHCDFDLYPGEILAVIGDNGAGKSSLIKAVSGAIVPDEGDVFLEGKRVNFTSPIDARKEGIETVYQTLAMSPALSIADNMFMGREIRKPGFRGKWLRQLDRPKMEQIARDKLSELGLMTIQNINQAVETLSGGATAGRRGCPRGCVRVKGHYPRRAHGGPRRQGIPSRAGVDPRCPFTWYPDYSDQSQHAACVRGRRPYPCAPPWQTAVRD